MRNASPASPPPARGIQFKLIGATSLGVLLLVASVFVFRERFSLGELVGDAVHAHAVQPQIADFLQRCEPAWPTTTLGL